MEQIGHVAHVMAPHVTDNHWSVKKTQHATTTNWLVNPFRISVRMHYEISLAGSTHVHKETCGAEAVYTSGIKIIE